MRWWAIFKIEKEGGDFSPGLVYFVGGIFSMFPLTLAVINVQSALLSWFAPNVWLIKEIASLVK